MISKRNFSRRNTLSLISGFGYFALAGCSQKSAANGVIELLYATPYSPTHPFSRADKTWIDFINNNSDGLLKVRPSWSGAIISSDQTMSEIRHGIADIGLITPIYAKGGVQLIRAQSGFYSGVKTIENQVALYRCLEAEIPEIANEMAGLKVLAVQGGSLPGLITKSKAVHNLKDLQGLRLRVPSELVDVMHKLGVDAVNMPMGEVYSSLAKGIIDGVIAPADTFKALHFAEVANFYTNLHVPRGAYPARAMRMDKFNELKPQQQDLLNRGILVWEAALAHEVNKALEDGFKMAREHKINEISISPQDQEEFEKIYFESARTNAAALSRYNIDGTATFQAARASIMDDGTIQCKGITNEPK